MVQESRFKALNKDELEQLRKEMKDSSVLMRGKLRQKKINPKSNNGG